MRKFVTLSLASATLLAAGLASAANAQSNNSDQRRPVPEMTRAQAQERAQKVFARMDANQDGKLDAADRAAREEARFKRIDANGDGAISLAEFTAPREHGKARGDRNMARRMGGHGFGAGGARGMMKAADTNGDGAIARDEFVAVALARFDKADSNADGTVSADERRAARPARVQRGMSS